MAVTGLDALVGMGLPAPISMFNRMCRSIFTRKESDLNPGWLRAKVLWEGRAQLGWLEPGQSVGSIQVGPEGQCVRQRGARRGRRGGVALPALWVGEEVGTACLAQGVWGEFIQKIYYFQASWVRRTQGGGSDRSLPGTSKLEVFSGQEVPKAQAGDQSPGQGSLCVMGVGSGVIEGSSGRTCLEMGVGLECVGPAWGQIKTCPFPPASLASQSQPGQSGGRGLGFP